MAQEIGLRQLERRRPEWLARVVPAGQAADGDGAPGGALDAQHVAVGQPASRCPGDDAAVVLAGDDQVALAGGRLIPQPDFAGAADEAVVQQVLADAPRHLPGLFPGAGQQQGVLAREMVSEERAAGQVDGFLGVAAADPALLFVQRGDGGVAGAQPQGGVAFPFAG